MKNLRQSHRVQKTVDRCSDGPCLGGSLPASLLARVCESLASPAGDGSELAQFPNWPPGGGSNRWELWANCGGPSGNLRHRDPTRVWVFLILKRKAIHR